jgi:hypothetical protein
MTRELGAPSRQDGACVKEDVADQATYHAFSVRRLVPGAGSCTRSSIGFGIGGAVAHREDGILRVG